MQSTAQVIADSLNTATGDRLTTLLLKYPRFIHAQIMTHRVFSRNAQSSRAIPTQRMIQKVLEENIEPAHWGQNQKGMQSAGEIQETEKARSLWSQSRDNAIAVAWEMTRIGVHKQIVNRVLEPFSSITVIVSSTEWKNFFDQRCHDDAQPEIQELATKMRNAIASSQPERLLVGQWHLPFINQENFDNVNDAIKVSVGKCARCSYLNHFGKHSVEDDIALCGRLIIANPPHLSPLEHQAQALDMGVTSNSNFTGWMQYRKLIEMS